MAVNPAKAGIQSATQGPIETELDSRFRGNDGFWIWSIQLESEMLQPHVANNSQIC